MKQYIMNIACLYKAKSRVSADRYPFFGGKCCFHFQGTEWGRLE